MIQTLVSPFIVMMLLFFGIKIIYMDTSLEDSTEVVSKEVVILDVEPKKIAITSNSYKKIKVVSINLYDEMKALFQKANTFSIEEKHVAAREIYDIIIDKLKNQKETKLLKLYYNAQILKSHQLNDDEAIEVYNEIIENFSKSDDIELLKRFANAQFYKSYLLNEEDTICVYDEVIAKFKDSNHSELLKEYSSAQFSKAYLLSRYFKEIGEAIDVYDEIIDKFESYKGDEFKQDLTNAMFAKSFLLMSEDCEKSMEVLDELIAKCAIEKTKVVTQTFEYSVVNNIELALITSNDDSSYRELADEYLSDLKDTKPQLDMLEILKNAQDLNQDELMNRWKEEYKDYHFENWSFEELRTWNNKMEDGEKKNRIKVYLDEFIKHNSP
jgi:tetratricopeptide (TPR) repeat protein